MSSLRSPPDNPGDGDWSPSSSASSGRQNYSKRGDRNTTGRRSGQAASSISCDTGNNHQADVPRRTACWCAKRPSTRCSSSIAWISSYPEMDEK
eukprot:763478-Hanusia_phi.AAC.5